MKSKWINRFQQKKMPPALGYAKLRAALEAVGSQGIFENNFGQAEPPSVKKPARRWYFLALPYLRRRDQLLPLWTHPRSSN